MLTWILAAVLAFLIRLGVVLVPQVWLATVPAAVVSAAFLVVLSLVMVAADDLMTKKGQ